jgi:hypothetical protein
MGPHMLHPAYFVNSLVRVYVKYIVPKGVENFFKIFFCFLYPIFYCRRQLVAMVTDSVSSPVMECLRSKFDEVNKDL